MILYFKNCTRIRVYKYMCTIIPIMNEAQYCNERKD